MWLFILLRSCSRLHQELRLQLWPKVKFWIKTSFWAFFFWFWTFKFNRYKITFSVATCSVTSPILLVGRNVIRMAWITLTNTLDFAVSINTLKQNYSVHTISSFTNCCFSYLVYSWISVLPFGSILRVWLVYRLYTKKSTTFVMKKR